jgi:Tripartite tricarboxylate transporter TctB family
MFSKSERTVVDPVPIQATTPDVEAQPATLADAEPVLAPNIVMPALFVVFGVIFLVSLRNLSWQSKGYPVAAGSVLVLFSLYGLLAELWRLYTRHRSRPIGAATSGARRRGSLVLRTTSWLRSKDASALLAVALLVITIFAAKQVGMYPAFGVYIPVQMLILRERNLVRLIAIDVLTLVVFYVVFVHFLKMYLPLW